MQKQMEYWSHLDILNHQSLWILFLNDFHVFLTIFGSLSGSSQDFFVGFLRHIPDTIIYDCTYLANVYIYICIYTCISTLHISCTYIYIYMYISLSLGSTLWGVGNLTLYEDTQDNPRIHCFTKGVHFFGGGRNHEFKKGSSENAASGPQGSMLNKDEFNWDVRLQFVEILQSRDDSGLTGQSSGNS